MSDLAELAVGNPASKLPETGAPPQTATGPTTQPAGVVNGPGEAAAAPPAAAPATATGEVNPAAGTVNGGRPRDTEPPPPAETQPTPAEIATLWAGKDGAYEIVRDYVEVHKSEYNTNPKARRFFAKNKGLDANKPEDKAKIDAEITRRERVLEALETVKIALEVAQGKRADWKKGTEKGTTDCYQLIGDDGVTVVREVWMHLAYEPILEEVKKLAEETESKDGAEKPTVRAEQVRKILGVLEPRLVPVTLPDGRKGFRIEPNLKNIEIKKAQETVIPFAYHILDTLLEPFGQKLEYGDYDKKTRRKRLKLDVEEWKKIGTSEEIGIRLSELSVLLTQYEDVDVSQYPQARANLAALIYDGVSQIYEKGVSSKIHQSLAEDYEKLKKYDSVFQNTRKALIGKVKDTMKQYYFKGQQIDPETIKFLETNLFHDLCFAYICQDHLTFNKVTNAVEFYPNLQKRVDDERAKGWIYPIDIQAIIALAAEKKAEQMLKNDLGFDLEKLKSQPISAYANRVIAGINAKRPDDKKMTPEEKENYHKVFDELQVLGEEAGRESKLGDWIKALGMLALILGPSVFKIFDEGTEVGQGQQARPG